MDRNSLIYKVRRKLQSIAYHSIPHERLSAIYYNIYLHEKLNLRSPESFNQKLQWYKLNYCPNSPLVVSCTDKFQVRDYVNKKGYSSLLTPLIGVWDSVKEIDWNILPDKFVLKCTHGCAYNILCNDKSSFDINLAKRQLNKWQKENFAAFNVEIHYEKIEKHRIICEEYLGDIIIDYKFFCFNGKPKFFYVSSDLVHDREAEMGFFDMNGKKIPLVRNDYKDIGQIEMPKCFRAMVQATKVLSEEFPFVRVDFFLVGESFRFAELTFTPGAAMMPISPKKYDIEWGKYIDLHEIKRKLED